MCHLLCFSNVIDLFPTVSEYNYRGTVFTPFLRWGKTQKYQAKQAEKAMCTIKQFLCRYKSVTLHEAFYLFDKMVLPIILYGCELWGYEKVNILKNVQVKFCKYLLKVGQQTPTLAVLGESSECGREYVTGCIKYYV